MSVLKARRAPVLTLPRSPRQGKEQGDPPSNPPPDLQRRADISDITDDTDSVRQQIKRRSWAGRMEQLQCFKSAQRNQMSHLRSEVGGLLITWNHILMHANDGVVPEVLVSWFHCVLTQLMAVSLRLSACEELPLF